MNNRTVLGIIIGMFLQIVLYNTICSDPVKNDKEQDYPEEDNTPLPVQINSHDKYEELLNSSPGDSMVINNRVYEVYDNNQGIRWIKPAGRESHFNTDPDKVRLWEEQQKIKQKQSEQLDEGDVREIIDQER